MQRSTDFERSKSTIRITYHRRRNHHSSKEQRETNGIEYTAAVVRMGGQFWKDVAKWLEDEMKAIERNAAA